MKKMTIIAISFLVVMLASSFVFAEAGKSYIRFGLEYVYPTGTKETVFLVEEGANFIEAPIKIEPKNAPGVNFGYEYMFTDLIGIAADLSYSKHDADMKFHGMWDSVIDGTIDEGNATGEIEGEISLMPLDVGVNFHPLKKEKLDFYLGPFVSYVTYSDYKLKKGKLIDAGTGDVLLELTSSENIKIKSDFGYGAVFGLDVPIGGQGWMFSSSLKYLSTKAKVDEPGTDEEIKIDPWILQLGFGYKF